MLSDFPSRNALVICDMQNDFVHPEGAYARGKVTSGTIAKLPVVQAQLARAIQKTGGWVVSTHYTLVPGRSGVPIISDHMKKLRPFLGEGDFLSGSWGHDVIDELKPVDFKVEKVAYSAFYMSRLEWVLRKAGVTHCLFAGIVTNGGVASTVRDAAVREYHCTLVRDACAAFSQNVHEEAVTGLAPVAAIATAEQVLKALG